MAVVPRLQQASGPVLRVSDQSVNLKTTLLRDDSMHALVVLSAARGLHRYSLACMVKVSVREEGRILNWLMFNGMRSMLPAVGLLAAYLLIVLLPLLLARLQGLPPRPFAAELSSALAMVAFAMLLTEFVLSGRFKHVTGWMGIDLTMRFHQLTARALTVFILIHPYFYVGASGSAPPWDSAGQSMPALDTVSFTDRHDCLAAARAADLVRYLSRPAAL